MTEFNWNALRDQAHENSINHGWWENKPSNEHFMCLIISELMEAVQADRKGKRADLKKYQDTVDFMLRELHYYGDQLLQEQKKQFEVLIKDTVEDELADAVIRIFDLAGANNVNLNGRICLQFVVTKKKTFTENTYAIIKDLVNSRYDLSDKLNYCRLQISHLAYLLDIDLLKYVKLKMEYNLTREYKHGKSY